MKLTYLILSLMSCVLYSVAESITAQQLMSDVVTQLPSDPLNITGNIVVRRKRGVVEKEMKFTMQLRWGDQPSKAVYTIQDSFGRSLEQLIVTRRVSSAPLFEYLKGDPLAASKTPDLFSSITDSDMSWMDITLSFLWWPGGEIVGDEDVRGRNCHIVEIPAPAGDSAGNYAKVRLWIDEQIHMLLQAEGFDKDGTLKKKLWVKSFKKIDERWMIKDMELQSYPAIHRTKLTVDDVESK